MHKYYIILCFICCPYLLSAQTTSTPQPEKKKKKLHTFYFSWGYNAETYTQSYIHVKQDELHNDYTLTHVNGRDHKGWNEGIFHQEITIPQYNYRIGYIFNEEKGYGVELNFDHTKFLIDEPQKIQVKGTMNGKNVDTSIIFDSKNGFYYYLNNGANFFLFNFVKRWHIWSSKSENIRIDGLGKAGIGPVIPHVQNSFFGHPNEQGFQFGGWNTGIEGTIKASFHKLIYLEICNKLDYARYSGLKVYKGTASQAFGTYEMILNLGINIPVRR
jgi:hypothetical protein